MSCKECIDVEDKLKAAQKPSNPITIGADIALVLLAVQQSCPENPTDKITGAQGHANKILEALERGDIVALPSGVKKEDLQSGKFAKKKHRDAIHKANIILSKLKT